jgi:serine/threonine protein kinase
MEYCEKGSLDKTLSGPKAYPMKKLLRIIKGIAAGVYHLHSENIVHRDLAARNILMAENLPRVADFGFSRAVERDGRGKTNASTGPIKWMAPESLRTKEYSKMSDVWSFGILCYEILAGKEPHADANPTEIGYKCVIVALVLPHLAGSTKEFPSLLHFVSLGS